MDKRVPAAIAPVGLAAQVEAIALEHAAVDRLLAAHLDAVMACDFAAALRAFDAFADALRAHLASEERLLLPRLDAVAAPHWASRVYQLEHDRIRLLLNHQRTRLVHAAAPVADAAAGRARALALIDAIHPLRHLLEHHQQREEQALFPELVAAAG